MKIIKIVSLILLGAFLWTSCDKLEAPFVKEQDDDDDTIVQTEFVKKVLLEDYTGHKCVNCPSAAHVAHELKEQFNDRLVIIAVHAGFFAQPSFEPYTADYTTEVGDELNGFFQVQSNPTGIINRVEYNGSLLNTDYENSWASAVGIEMNKEAVADIEIINDFADASSTLNTTVNVEFKELNTEPVYLCVYIVESGIISAQKNNDEEIGDTPEILDYEHNHVLRGSLNGTWGEELLNPTDLVYNVTLPSFTLDNEWVPENCDIVAFIYDQNSFEVLQVEDVPVIQ